MEFFEGTVCRHFSAISFVPFPPATNSKAKLSLTYGPFPAPSMIKYLGRGDLVLVLHLSSLSYRDIEPKPVNVFMFKEMVGNVAYLTSMTSLKT